MITKKNAITAINALSGTEAELVVASRGEEVVVVWLGVILEFEEVGAGLLVA